MPSLHWEQARHQIGEETMERSHDILQSFQSLSISATTLDFGPEFASGKMPEEFAEAINQYLKLHAGNRLQKFRLFFCPLDTLLPDIENWIAFAVAKGVEELDLDLSMAFDRWTGEFTNGAHSFKLPGCLFHCKSLTNLCLSHCDFYPPSNFACFDCLQSLSLVYVSITEDILQRVLLSCPLLDNLSLKGCLSLDSIKVSAQDLRLQRLAIVDCWNVMEIEICAPKLRSFIYSGEHVFGDSFIDVSSLVDAFISALNAESSEPEHDYIKLLSDLSHVKILTVCPATLWRVNIYEEIDAESLPISLSNLKELQLLMSSMCSEDLACIYSFFRLCPSPFLEKLFIQLPKISQQPDHRCCVITVVQEPSDVVFSHLKMIKLSNFNGCAAEMRLVRFLLERAVVLVSLVIVTPQKTELKESMDVDQSDAVSEANSKDRLDLMMLREQLALLPKTSAGANVIVCEYMEDYETLNPTHTEYYCDFYF